MKKRGSILSLLILCAFSNFAWSLEAEPEEYSLWKHSVKIHFNTTVTGANTVDNLLYFPVLIRLDNSLKIISQSLAGGADLRFADENGAHLNYQIERWDAGVGKAEVWVKVHAVDGNSAKDYITVYWGKADAKSQSNGPDVFPAWNGFSGVWHLGESGKVNRPNASLVGSAATPQNYEGDESVAGIIGMADSLDGMEVGDYLNLGPLNLNLASGLTFSLWINSSAPKAPFAHYFDLSNGPGSDNIIFGGNVQLADTYFKSWGINTENGALLAPNGLDLNSWTHITATVLGLDMAYYKNGIKTATGKLIKPIAEILRSQNFLGRSAWVENPYFRGKVDEPIISQVQRSADWIKLSYENQRLDSKFITFDKVVEAGLVILSQPRSESVKEASPLTLTVLAHSGNSISYQWFKNGVPIVGANASVYSLTAVSAMNTGAYICRISDGLDTVETTSAEVQLSENYALWGRSLKIICNTTAGKSSTVTANDTITTSGAGVENAVANFSLLIRLSQTHFNFSEALENGEDIRFSDITGNPVAYEIEAWDSQAKEACIWVRVPEVKGNANQQILTMLWKRPGVTTRSNSAAVFRAEDGYRGVWHLNEAGSENAQDAVSRNFSGMNKAAIGGEKGVIAGSFRFNGISSHIELPLLATSGLANFSISLWAKERVGRSSLYPYQAPTLIGMATNNSGSGDFGIVSNGGLLSAWHGLDSVLDQATLPSISLNDGNWHHIVVTYAGPSIIVYESGSRSKESGANFKAVAPFALGLGASHFPNDAYPNGFDGQLDAVEISSTVRSADWIKLAYENQRTGSSMLGFTNPVDQAPIIPAVIVITSLDTLLSGETVNLDSKHKVGFPVQGNLVPVMVSFGQAWEVTPVGFDSVGARFKVDLGGTKSEFPKLQILGLDSNSQIALYQQLSTGTIQSVPRQDGQFWVSAAGTYFWARDIAPPKVQSVASYPIGLDSMRVLVWYKDNVENIKGSLYFWNGKRDTTQWTYATTGDSLVFQIPNPAQAGTPMEIQIILSDHTQWSYFPGNARTYTLKRSLPGFTQSFNLKPGYVWKLAGIPLDSTTAITLGQLGPSGSMVAAVWGQAKQDSDFVLLNSSDILPRGKAFWMASENGLDRITLPASRGASTDTDGFFPMQINHGWNMVTGPSFRSLVWPSTRKFTNAYMQSDLKGLWRFDGTDYQFADTLKPWEGYYVYHNGQDTIIRIGTLPLGATKPAAGKMGEEDQGAQLGLGLQMVLGANHTQPLALGSAHFAQTAIGQEDELLPPGRVASDNTRRVWLSRAGRALVSDFVALDPNQIMSWKLVSQGMPAGRPLEVLAASLPHQVQAWAVAPSRRMKYQLKAGVEVPLVGADTLLILAGTPEQLSRIKDWRLSQSTQPHFSYSIYSTANGYSLEMALPSQSHLKIRALSVSGRLLAQWNMGEVGEGHHFWTLATSYGRKSAVAGMSLVEIRIEGPNWRFQRTQRMGPVP